YHPDLTGRDGEKADAAVVRDDVSGVAVTIGHRLLVQSLESRRVAVEERPHLFRTDTRCRHGSSLVGMPWTARRVRQSGQVAGDEFEAEALRHLDALHRTAPPM